MEGGANRGMESPPWARKDPVKLQRSYHMRIVLQRVLQSNVEVDNKTVGEITHGFLIFLGITHKDTEQQADWLIEKILKLRVFEDEEGKMNKSIEDVGGSLLIVSQFTLYGDCKKGARPSFIDAARPEQAIPLYDYFVNKAKESISVETGEFGAHMAVSLVNDGPVTLILEK